MAANLQWAGTIHAELRALNAERVSIARELLRLETNLLSVTDLARRARLTARIDAHKQRLNQIYARTSLLNNSLQQAGYPPFNLPPLPPRWMRGPVFYPYPVPYPAPQQSPPTDVATTPAATGVGSFLEGVPSWVFLLGGAFVIYSMGSKRGR